MSEINEYFTTDEFACHCGCGQCIIDKDLVRLATEFRQYLDKPINVHCVNRCTKHNADVGGEKKSLHIEGLAMDMHVVGMDIKDLKQVAWSLWNEGKILSGGLGLYKDFIHIDVGGKRSWKG